MVGSIASSVRGNSGRWWTTTAGMSKIAFGLFVLLVVAGCTRRNPAVCCVTEAECERIGLPFPSRCEGGLACRGFDCVEPTCTRQGDCDDPTLPYCVDGLCVACDSVGNLGCEPSAPVCDLMTATCGPCHGNDDCAGYPDAPICSAAGVCIGCTQAAECANPTPVCEAGACRRCQSDLECALGACDSDGRCVESSSIVFVAPGGVDGGTCTEQLPCATLAFAVTQVTPARAHIVMRPGDYPLPHGGGGWLVSSLALYIHGFGATLRPALALTPDGRDLIRLDASSLTISGLAVEQSTAATGSLIHCLGGGSVKFDGVHIAVPYQGVRGDCDVTIEQSSLNTGVWAVSMDNGRLDVRRSVLGGGLQLRSGSLEIVNNLIHGFGIEVGTAGTATGKISFNTVVDTALLDDVARAIRCSNFRDPDRPEVVSNIIWAPTGSASVIVSGCRTHDNLIGPIEHAGNLNADPQFIGNGNYHLRPTSPAIDKAATGPAVDRDGDPRPQGNGYDYGADEVVP